ncbi:solute carrier family 35 member F5-like [Anneissia japonica]|uniref:solute carrier family 35 member F5-like n=1 Tax=Anneissia japonica TaxID=1529436 RepID=UPI001425A798|nr:solute carrier family 35 member F5-like [Anneissia japonica]XP_033126333.1 solute carrier family 35 member F5-like [Anneissia japonica]
MMSLTSGLTRPRRLVLGVIVLLLVDIIWVLSAELTGYTFKEFNKPFFTTYVKTSMFMLYMLGFLFWKPWQKQCMECMHKANKPHSIIVNGENSSTEEDSSEDNTLSEPLYVPVKFDDSDKLSSRSDSFSESCDPSKHVRFSNIMEVRQLSEKEAHEAALARLSYSASLRAQQDQQAQLNSKLSVPQVAKVSFMFCLVWFLGNLSYQEAIDDTQVAVVQVFSSTSGLFTLVLAAIFPSSNGDRFTLSKLVAVLVSLGGITLISLSGTNSQDHFKLGSLWALLGAVLYAIYMVMLKKKVDNEDRLDIPMFFGFVGLFNFLIIWPGFFIMNNFHLELFELPTKKVWCYIVVNGLVGTVLSEFLWLWGCFLTSSLIATLSLSLTIPLSVIADIFLNNVKFTWMFFAGAGPVFLSFIAVSILNHYNDWDPIRVAACKLLNCIKSLVSAIFKKRSQTRLPEDQEQTESLISMHDIESDSDSLKCCGN